MKPHPKGKLTKGIKRVQILCLVLLVFIAYLWKEKIPLHRVKEFLKSSIQKSQTHPSFARSKGMESELFSHKYQSKVNKYLKTFIHKERLKKMRAERNLLEQFPLIDELAQDRAEDEIDLPIGGSSLKQQNIEEKIYKDIKKGDEDSVEVGLDAKYKSLSLSQDIQNTIAFKQWQKDSIEEERKHVKEWLIQQARKEGYRIRLNKDFVITEIQPLASPLPSQRVPSSSIPSSMESFFPKANPKGAK